MIEQATWYRVEIVKIVKINGGLGNQMFSYALYHVLCKNNKYTLTYIDIAESAPHHNGFELDKVFPVIEQQKVRMLKGFTRVLSLNYLNNFFKEHKQEKVGFLDYILSIRNAFSIYNGFWQSERYFQEYRQDIMALFTFNQERINDKTRKLLNTITDRTSVSVHIRRGDYLGNTELDTICGPEYYKKAISLLSCKLTDPVFYLFTDDKDWVRSHFSGTNFVLVDWNKGADSWQDMFLMSQCDHNIIANSTFSWWGAWLNKHDSKYVVAPSRWFSSTEDPDIIPEKWIRI